MANPNTTMNEQEIRLRVLSLAIDIAHTQHQSKFGEDAKANASVENTIDRDTIRNAKRLWKFVKSDPLAEKDEES